MAADEIAQQIWQAQASKSRGAEPDLARTCGHVSWARASASRIRRAKPMHLLAVGGEHHRMGVAHEQAAAGGGTRARGCDLAHRRLTSGRAERPASGEDTASAPPVRNVTEVELGSSMGGDLVIT